MRNRLMTSAAVLTILLGSSAAFAQSAGTGEAPSGGGATQHAPTTAPHSGTGSSSQMNKSQPSDTHGAAPRQDTTQSGHSARDSHQNAQDTQSDKMNQRGAADDHQKGDRMKNSASENHKYDNKDNKNAERRGTESGTNSQHSETRSQTTTGQAGAGAKLSTEQRTKITSVIREQRVQPETSINFNVSVGTRVPKRVHFHPLPAEIVTVYPDWRGYEFFLVRDEIVVVNPRTLEIVAVLEA